MLGLKLPSDPRWVNIAEKNIEEILSDHAFCEQKAASTAISLIVSFPEYTELVQEMIALVEEEMSHFKMVHDLILERGFHFRSRSKRRLCISFTSIFSKRRKSNHSIGTSLATYAALIEARSCERFRLLSEHLEDKKLG